MFRLLFQRVQSLMMESGEARHGEASQPMEQEQMVKSLHAMSPRSKDRLEPKVNVTVKGPP